MKKNLLLSAIALLGSTALLLNGCSKDDTTAPSLSLSGSTTINQSLPATAGGGSWTDPGYSATDDEDGTVTSSIYVSGTVDPNKKGTYTLTYSVSDKAGNQSTATRTVNIVNDAEAFAGTYATSTDTCEGPPITGGAFSPSPVITTSDTVNNLIWISNFGGLDPSGAYKIRATISGSTITVPVPQNMSGTVSITNFYSAGSAILSATSPTSIDIKYQWDDGTGTDICVSHYRR